MLNDYLIQRTKIWKVQNCVAKLYVEERHRKMIKMRKKTLMEHSKIGHNLI